MPLFSEYRGFRNEIDKSIQLGIEYIVSGEKVGRIEITASKMNEVESLINRRTDFSVSVIVINTKTGAKLQAGTIDAFNGASTTKIISAICYLKEIENDHASFSEPMGNYDSEFQFKQMLNQSNNVSLDLINSEIGINNLTNCAKNIGVSGFTYYENTVSPSEISNVMLKLARYELVSREHTDKMLSYMQRTNEERLIPTFLPDDYTCNHKYGILNGNLHDLAIVKGDGEKFILSIYTNGPDFGEAQLTDRINFFKEIMGILFREE